MTWMWWFFLFDILVLFILWAAWKTIGSLTKIFLDLQIQLPYEETPDLPGERVVFESMDGIALPGLFIKSPKSQGRTVIFAPEFGADLGSYRKYVEHLPEAGFNLFAFEFRGHGPYHVSEGYIPSHWPTLYEVNDMLGAIRFVSLQRDVDPKRIALFGVSKGACIAICTAGISDKVSAVISDSAFSTRSTAISYIERWGPIFIRSSFFWNNVPRWFLSFMQRVSMAISGMIRGCHFISVSDYLKYWRGIPIFFIHGERDSYIPATQVDEMQGYLKNNESIAWIVPKARHNESAVVARDEYQRRTVEFLNKYLPLHDS